VKALGVLLREKKLEARGGLPLVLAGPRRLISAGALLFLDAPRDLTLERWQIAGSFFILLLSGTCEIAYRESAFGLKVSMLSPGGLSDEAL
jgi:hypothetical protein